MKLGRLISEVDALKAFLRAELDSRTESRRLQDVMERGGVGPAILVDSPPGGAEEPAVGDLFQQYRGWEEVFSGLEFSSIRWHLAELTFSDCLSIVETCRNTFEDTYGTRSLAAVASAWDRQGLANPVATRFATGENLEPPLLIAEPDLSRLVVLEGHNRLIGYVRAPQRVPFPIAVIVGVSPVAARWSQW